MPIGKNAIKRITNNGYSNVQSSAPDMENSEVAVEKIETVKEENSSEKANASTVSTETKPKQKTSKKTPSKKTTAPKKSMETEPDFAPVNTLEKVIEKTDKTNERQGEGYVNLGGKLPIHLL